MKTRYVSKSAHLSPDQVYRYCLERVWDKDLPMLVCVGLNPSTADHEADDNTIRKVVEFAKRWGFGGIVMINLYAYRATLPVDMKRALKERGEAYVIGPMSDHVLCRVFANYEHIWFAWGAHGAWKRAEALLALAQAYKREPFCIGINGDGSPLHPVMAAYKCPRAPWKMPTARVA